VLTVGLLYRDFVVIFVREILPAALTAHGSEGGVLDSAGTTLERIWIFYGFGFPALSVAGFVLLRRRARPEAARVVTAYALAFAGLLLLRSVPGGLFKDLKEVEFAVPLVALTAGASLEELAARGRLGRWAAALVAVGLAGFSLARYANYVATWTALAP